VKDTSAHITTSELSNHVFITISQKTEGLCGFIKLLGEIPCNMEKLWTRIATAVQNYGGCVMPNWRESIWYFKRC